VKFYRSPRFLRAAKRLGKFSIVGLVALVIFTYTGLQYSAKPEFCKICHYMEPYYDGWKTSTHNMVPCVECHYPPSVEQELKGKVKAVTSFVQYFTGVYGKSRPWVEISEGSCLREGCHNRRLLSGRENFGNILFDHTPHLTEMRRGKKLRCTSCHSQIVQREHMTVTTTTCFLCHFKRVPGEKTLDDCNLCHGAPLSPVQYLGVKFDHSEALKRGVECRKCHMHVIQGNGEVSKDRCFSCHTESEKLEKFNDALLMHDNHVTKHKVDCLRCHDQIRHQMTESTQSVEMECTSCHPNQHSAQKELFLGIGGSGVDYMPDPMFLTKVSCTSCHISHQGDPYRGSTSYSSEAACVSCHGTEYGAILKQWKREMKDMLAVIIPSLEKSKAEFKRASRPDHSQKEKARGLIEEAENNVKLVSYGKGVHNIKYSVSLLTVANEKLKEAMQVIGSGYAPKTLPVSQAVVKSECYSCHLGIEEKKTTFQGKPFDHSPHLLKVQLPCERCHSNQRKHGETILKLNDCRSCHHPDQSINCANCHGKGPAQAVAYENVDFQHAPHSSEQGLDCLLCHQLKDGMFAIDPKMDCFSCHHPMEGKNCGDCHHTQSQVLSGEGVLDYKSIPGVMSSLKCTDCHGQLEQGKTAEIVKTACQNCHNPSYSDTLSQWQKEITDQMILLKEIIERQKQDWVDSKGTKGNAEKEEAVKRALDYSVTRMTLVEKDGSLGGHNYLLIHQMLEEAKLKLDEVEKQNR